MNAEIIAIGDEITSGQTLDTNTQWMSQRLEELGVRVLYHTTVGDELAPNIAVFRAAIARADVVVATGGLGPTADDLTRQALAEAVGRPLKLDTDALETIRAMFARRNRPMPSSNELQAMFPEGSRVVHNPNGTAPGIDIEIPRESRGPCRVICLPGVPAEMVEMWNDSVAATIASFVGHSRRVVRRRTIHCFGAGESQVEAMLPDLIRRGRRPTVGITASRSTITLRITADGATDAECLAAIEPVAATIYECLGTLVFGEGDDQLQDAVVRLLREQGKTLATAECGTSGLLAEQLGGVAGCEDVFRGGLVFPSPAESVEEMAKRCREQFHADVGLAVGPFPQNLPSPACGRGAGGEGCHAYLTANPVRQTGSTEVVLALATSEGVQSAGFPFAWHPALSRTFCVKQALNFVRLA